MNKFRILITIALLFVANIALLAQSKTDKIKVSGNCGSCKKHIETAAKAAGASSANWDKKTKVLAVTYDASKTSNDAIQKKIAAAGYDTEQYAGDEKAYNALDECCQYDGKKKTAGK